jgi:hypothetical protein
MVYMSLWCCKTENNIWEEDGIEPPCEICPNNFKLTETNRQAARAFHDLDTSGRDIGFDVGWIREEAIDVYLNRFGCNTPDVYAALKQMDRGVTVHRLEKAKLERELKQNRPKPTSSRRSARGRR